MRTETSNLGSKAILAAVATIAASSLAMAVVPPPVTWDGGTANWADIPSHWSNGSTPDLAGGVDTAAINSGSVSYTGPDLQDNSNLTISGTGTWTQTTNNWIKIGSGLGKTGTLDVTGGTFNTGTVTDHLWVGYDNSTGHINVNGGSVIASGTYLNGATSSISVGSGSFQTGIFDANAGGSLTVTGGSFTSTASGMDVNTGNTFSLSNGTVTFSGGEFKPKKNGLVTISGGTLNVNLISFDGDASATIAFSGGRINDVAATWDGIYSGGGYVNYLANSTGVLFLQNLSNASAVGLISDGKVRVNGIADTAQFSVTTDQYGSYIQLIPEPASLTAIGLVGLVGLRRRRR